MTALYLNDSYLKTFTGTVTAVDGNLAYLDQTAFYPTGGGQPHDTGTLEANGKTYHVISVKKTPTGIAHEIDNEGLQKGDPVTGTIDWDRRYTLMRMHTASHCLSATIHDQLGAKITGHSMSTEKSHIDFSLETFDREQLAGFIDQCNKKINAGKPVTLSWMNRDDALADPELVKLANVLPPSIKKLRIVTIEGIDRQADGGTHVKNTSEIGTLELSKLENKGKGRKRIYFTLKPQA